VCLAKRAILLYSVMPPSLVWNARVIDETLFDQTVDIPAVNRIVHPRQWHFDLRAVIAVDSYSPSAAGLAKIRLERLDQSTQTNGTEIQARVIVDGPVSAYRRPRESDALLVIFRTICMGVECFPSGESATEVRNSESLLQCRRSASLLMLPWPGNWWSSTRCTREPVPQQFVDRDAQRLAFDVHSAYRARPWRPASRVRRIKTAAKIELPKVIDLRRIVANEHLGALANGVPRAASPNRDALVGFDGTESKL